MKVLVISPRFPYPLEKGDKLRLYHQLRLLSDNYEIVLVSLSDTKIASQDLSHIKTIVSNVYVFPLSKIRILFRLIFGIFSNKPFQILYFFNKKYKRKIKEIVKEEKPDIIFNQLIRTAEYSRDLNGFKIIDYMDSFSEGMRKRFDNSGFLFRMIYKTEYKRLKKYEFEVFDDFDKHSIISQQDRDTFSEKIRNKISIVPNGVDMDFFQPRDKNKDYDIGFVGNMGYRPNIIACEYFVQKILPLLKKDRDDIKILFAGARPHTRVKSLESKNVFVSGWMEDIRDAYDRSKIFVAPIFTGIGQQNKILEAMAMEIPVVTTVAVNKAIGAKPGEEIIIASTEQDFSKAILELLDNPQFAENTCKAGRKFVQKNYSWDIQSSKLYDLFSTNF